MAEEFARICFGSGLPLEWVTLCPLWLGSGDVLSKGQCRVFIIVRCKVTEIGKPGGVISSEAERHITRRPLSVKIQPPLSSLFTDWPCVHISAL